MIRLGARFLVLVAVASAIGARTSAQEAAPKHLLRYSYEVGKTTWYRRTAVQQRIKGGDAPMTTTTDTEVMFRCDTQDVVDGKATLRRTFTRVKAKFTGRVTAEFDSADPESQPGQFEMQARMVDQWVEERVDDHGRVGEPAMSADMFAGGLKEWVTQGVPTLPDAPVAIGESWTEVSKQPVGVGDIKSTTTTLVAVEGKQAKLHQVMELNTDGFRLSPRASLAVDKCEGDTTLDLATGMLITSSMTVTAHAVGTGVAANTTLVTKLDLQRIDPPPATEAKGRDSKDKDKGAGGK